MYVNIRTYFVQAKGWAKGMAGGRAGREVN